MVGRRKEAATLRPNNAGLGANRTGYMAMPFLCRRVDDSRGTARDDVARE